MDPASLKGLRRADVRRDAIEFELTDEFGHDGDNAAFVRRMQQHSCRYVARTPSGYSRGMERTASEIRDWMKSVLAEKDWSPARWAKEAGVAPSTIQRAIKDDYAFVTSSRTLDKLARAVNIPAPSVSENHSPLASPQFLAVRYRAGAGIWHEVGDVQAFEGVFPVTADPAYAGYSQWLERVVGDSMDREYPDGCFVHVVSTDDMAYSPRPGDHVILVRYRNDGQEIERTIKEVVRNGRKLEFWPRSTNARWNAPVVLNGGNGDQIADLHRVEVAGLVLGSYRPRRAP